MLRVEFVLHLGATQQAVPTVFAFRFIENEIVTGKRGVTPGNAFCLARFSGIRPGFRLNLQMVYDLQQAEENDLTS